MTSATLERIGILLGLIGLIGAVAAAWIVSPLLALILASAILVAAGVLLIALALRREALAKAPQPGGKPTTEERS